MFSVEITIKQTGEREETDQEYYDRTGRPWSDRNVSAYGKKLIHTDEHVIGHGIVTSAKLPGAVNKASDFLGIHEERGDDE